MDIAKIEDEHSLDDDDEEPVAADGVNEEA
jgi:hypothetical protein